MIRMPGESFRGKAPPLSADEKKLRDELIAHVQKLGGEIGERNLAYYPQLQAAAQYIESELSGWKVRRDGYEAQGRSCYNLEAELPGTSPGIVLIGAHYDSVYGSPGANDNGSGVAALLALAHRLAGRPNEKTLRIVAFVNEEPGYFQTPQMGSFVYASRCRDRGDQIEAMISLETIGYFSSQSGSQKYPVPGLALIYPRTGNFIGFVSNVASRSLLRAAIGDFRRKAQIPSEGGALPAMVPGVGWSDQWSFWQYGYPGIMVTDTAPFRYPYYHSADDTPDKLDYDSMTRVVAGMEKVILHLLNPHLKP
jgi:Peptidase family M28